VSGVRNFHVPANAEDMEIIDAFIEHQRRLGRTEDTRRTRREILGRLDRDLPDGIGRTSREELSTWLYRDEWSQNTRYTYYSTIKAFYAWASDPKDPWIDLNPAEDLEPVKQPKGRARPVTDDQLRKILTEGADPFRLWATIAAYQGLRCIEISRLDREHVTEQQLFVFGKGNRPRVHDTHPAVWAAVKDLPRGPIAVHPRTGERATPFEVSAEAALYFRRKLGMPGVAMHRLRHWMGTTVQRTYRDIRVTQAMLGHASLQSTQIYTDATQEQQREARAMLPTFTAAGG
jgi:integrase/recombinase XerC